MAWYLSNPTTTQCCSAAYISEALVRSFISSIVVASTPSSANLSKTGSQTCMASEVEPHFAPWSTAMKGGVLLVAPLKIQERSFSPARTRSTSSALDSGLISRSIPISAK